MSIGGYTEIALREMCEQIGKGELWLTFPNGLCVKTKEIVAIEREVTNRKTTFRFFFQHRPVLIVCSSEVDNYSKLLKFVKELYPTHVRSPQLNPDYTDEPYKPEKTYTMIR